METDFFLLTATAKDNKGRCELQYWGRTPEGVALIQITNTQPLFFVPRTAQFPESLKQIMAERRLLNLTTFKGEKVDGVYFKNMYGYRKGLIVASENDVEVLESDVNPEDRYLMERFITGSARIFGKSYRKGSVAVFENPWLRPSNWRPQLITLSLDIETGTDGSLYSAAMDVRGPEKLVQKVGIVDSNPTSKKIETLSDNSEALLYRFPDERRLLHFIVDTIQESNSDVLIGWYVIGFDLAFLDKVSQRVNFPLRMGREGKPLHLYKSYGNRVFAQVEGRLIIDGPPALRGSFHTYSNWKLDTVAEEVLGERKNIQSSGLKKVREIERQFREDKVSLARYNLQDTILVSKIFEKTGVLDQLISRSLITGLPLDKVHKSVASFDWFFLPRLHRKGFVASDKKDIKAGSHTAGGKVFTEGAGVFRDVAIFDFKSLYPSVIRTFCIDPYALLKADVNPVDTPVGIQFSREENILPSFLENLMAKRAKARLDGDEALSQAVKILMNSMYGVMGSPRCRFYHPELPTAITGIGRWTLDTTADLLNRWGYKVLYGDTDSVFVQIKKEKNQTLGVAGKEIVNRVNRWFAETIETKYGVKSLLELEFEKEYLQLFLPKMRHGIQGALKRYAGLLPDGRLEIKGMEYVRSDSTALARDFQYELFRRFFAGEELQKWILSVVKQLRAGELDEKLIYKRRLSRPLWKYKSNPPHVKAMKMLNPDGSRQLRTISYVITPEGPVPIELNPTSIDYDHYVRSQLRSLADDVLTVKGECFDEIIEGRQSKLF